MFSEPISKQNLDQNLKSISILQGMRGQGFLKFLQITMKIRKEEGLKIRRLTWTATPLDQFT